MSIITYNDFTGEQDVAGVSNPGTRQSLELFIEEYEPIFLESLLGLTLAAEFAAGLTEDPIDPKWLFLRDSTSLKKMLTCFVYYYYMQNETTLTAAVSEVKPKVENSAAVSGIDKYIKSWNKMVLLVRKFTLDRTIYPSYPLRLDYWIWSPSTHYSHCHEQDSIYEFKNSLGL